MLVPKWTDDDYRNAFAEGHTRNQYVADLIASWGVWVDCPPLTFAERREDIRLYTNGEKDVITRAGVIEVKGQRRLFTSDVNKFPYETQIVDTVESWDGKTVKPIAYVMVCMQNLECVAIPTKSEPHWTVTKRFDRYKQQEFEFYVVHRRFIRSMDDLRQHLLRHDKA